MTATNKFAQIPFYMLRDYWTELGSYYTNDLTGDTSTNLDQLSPVVFTDTEDAEWNSENGYLDWNGTLTRTAITSSMNNARLATPGHFIIAAGGGWTNLYVEKESYGYREVAVRPQWEKEWIDDNWFKFDLIEIDRLSAGFWKDSWAFTEVYEDYKGSLVESYDNGWTILKDVLTNGLIDTEVADPVNSINTIKPIDISKSQDNKTFGFKVYIPKNQQFSENAQLVPEDTFYFRKDSFFFDWFRKNLKYLGSDSTFYGTRALTNLSKYDQWNHSNFVNDNLSFTYFGWGMPIHQEDTEWMIQHHSMKNFMINALPPNDLNEANRTFIWETMDRVYEEPYNMAREVQTLLDPEEISDRLLPMLGSFYNVDIASLREFDDIDLREFVKSLPTLLKKKGTQASLAIIWRAIVNSKNKVTFYERWHEMYANEPITAISFELLEQGQPDPGVVKPGGEGGTEGGGPPAEVEHGFPNPMGLINYAVLYCFDRQIDAGAQLWKSEVYLFWDNKLVYMKNNQYSSTMEYLTTEVQRIKTVVDGMTYLIGTPIFEMDISAGVSEAAHSNGKIKFFALARRPKQPGDEGSGSGGTVYPPVDIAQRFLTNIADLEKYNSPIMVECRAVGLYTFEDNFYCKIVEKKNSSGVFTGSVNVDIFWQSAEPVLSITTPATPWLTHNFIMNHVNRNFFGNSTSSFKVGYLVKEYNTQDSLTSYWSIARYLFNKDWINGFIKPDSTDNPAVENTIMYSYNEPAYYVKLSINQETLRNSILEVWWNNIKVYEVKAPAELKDFNEIKFWGQNYIIDVGKYKYFCWPNFMDRLDDMSGAEMDFITEGNMMIYYYKVKRVGK